MTKRKLIDSQYKVKEHATPVTIIAFVLLLIYTLGLFIPLLWALIVSFTDYEWYDSFYNLANFKNIGFPKMTFENFINAFQYLSITSPATEKVPETTYNLLGLFENSLLYSIGCAITFTLCPCITAYAAARFKFKFSKFIYGFVIVALSLPIVGAMPSEIRMLKLLNLDTWFLGMWVLRFNFLSVYFLIFYAQFQSIPKDYTEAAKIDGASNFRIMTKIVMPQALNSIVTVFILSFITYWNDYQIPLLYMPAYPTAASAIYTFTLRGQGGNITNRVPVQMAATLIMILPILLVYIIFNKKLRVSVAMGGIKG